MLLSVFVYSSVYCLSQSRIMEYARIDFVIGLTEQVPAAIDRRFSKNKIFVVKLSAWSLEEERLLWQIFGYRDPNFCMAII